MEMQNMFWGMLEETSITIIVVLGLLLVMSVGSWFVIISKTLTLRGVRRRTERDLNSFRQARTLGQAMRAISHDQNSSLYRIGLEAVRELKRIEASDLDVKLKSRLAKDNLRRTLRGSISAELGDLVSHMSFLGTCANATPFIGLFGTVWGIMRAFQSVAVMKTAAITAVAPGMAEALITTVLGLAVAIPSTIAYNAIQGMLAKVENVLVIFAGEFLNRAHREMPWMAESEE